MTDRKGAVWFRPPEVAIQLPLEPAEPDPDPNADPDPYWDNWGFDAEDVARVINEACERARARADDDKGDEDVGKEHGQ